MKIVRRLCILAIGVVSILVSTTQTAPIAVAASSCQNLAVPVRLAPGLAQDQIIRGTLCLPDTPTTHIDILLHGATYNREYWNWPVEPATYSYVERTLQAGRATFAYDRLGAGQSSRPASALVTVESDAYILHQIIQYMRSHQGLSDITAVGHSLGSVVAQYEAGKYKDVNRLVVTGLIHAQGVGAAGALTSFYPAALDPQFSGLIDVGYLTTTPGSRSLFYNSTADPQIVTYDEAHKDIVSSVQLAQSFPFTLTPAILNVTSQITAPVFVIVGDEDALSCGLLVDCKNLAAVSANEAPYYLHAASLVVGTVNNTGHDIALHPSAGQSFAAISQWITTH